MTDTNIYKENDTLIHEDECHIVLEMSLFFGYSSPSPRVVEDTHIQPRGGELSISTTIDSYR